MHDAIDVVPIELRQCTATSQAALNSSEKMQRKMKHRCISAHIIILITYTGRLLLLIFIIEIDIFSVGLCYVCSAGCNGEKF